MNAMDLLETIGGIRDAYVVAAHSARKQRRMPRKRMLLIAAIIAVALLLAGCTVLYVLRLQNLRVRTITVQDWQYDADGTPYCETEETRSLLSPHVGQAEQQALREWESFKEGYDQDRALAQVNNFNESGVPENFFQNYDCYTFEMLDAFQAILDKYHLKPLGRPVYFSDWEEGMLYKALQIPHLVRSGQTRRMAGYFFPEGSFKAEFSFCLPEEQEERIVSFVYANDGYLYPYFFVVGDVDAWEQWDYTTADGTQVVLATWDNALAIFCQRPDGTIYISAKNQLPVSSTPDDPAPPMTRELAQQIADCFDYTIAPQSVDWDEAEAMRADFPQPEPDQETKRRSFILGFGTRDGVRWSPPAEYAGSIEAYARHILADYTDAANLEYCVSDWDGDGQAETIIRNKSTGMIWQVIKMLPSVEDPAVQEVALWFGSYLCENGVIKDVYTVDEMDIGPTQYFDFTNSTKTEIYTKLRMNLATGQWEQRIDPNDYSFFRYESITQEAAEALIAQYRVLDFDMQPLSEYGG